MSPQGVRFQGTTPQIQALAINELEVAAFGPEALALAVDNAHLDVRMIADVFQDGVPDYGTVTYVVRKDSPIKTVEDLHGKTVATNAIGSFGDSAMRINLRAARAFRSRHHVGRGAISRHAGDARRGQGRSHQPGAATTTT